MAYEFYVQIRGAKQGRFTGDEGPAGKAILIRGLAFHYELTAPTSTTGMAAEETQHSPVTLVKEWGASSPQLLQAALDHESLDLQFDFYKMNTGGVIEHTHTVNLEGARITAMKQDIKGFVGVPDAHDLEEIAFVFDQIEMYSVVGGASAADSSKGAGAKVSGASAASGGGAESKVSRAAAGTASGGAETKFSSAGAGTNWVREPSDGMVGAEVAEIPQARLSRIPRSG